MISIPTLRQGITTGPDTTVAQRWSLTALWLALALQTVWMTGLVFPEPGAGELGVFDVIVVAICGGVALTSARMPWLVSFARIWAAGLRLPGGRALRPVTRPVLDRTLLRLERHAFQMLEGAHRRIGE